MHDHIHRRRRIIITVIIWCHASSSIQPATLYTMPMSHDATDDAKTEGERERESERSGVEKRRRCYRLRRRLRGAMKD